MDIVDVPALLLRATLEELLNQIEHLERSQEEIHIAFAADPSDADFSDALRENEVTLNTKKANVLRVHGELLRIDPAYRAEYEHMPHLASILVASLSMGNAGETKSSGPQNADVDAAVGRSGSGLYL